MRAGKVLAGGPKTVSTVWSGLSIKDPQGGEVELVKDDPILPRGSGAN